MCRSTFGFITMIVFATVYVVAISTYTYVSSLSTVDLLEKTVRNKRQAVADLKNLTLNICCEKNQTLNGNLDCVDEKLVDSNELNQFVVNDEMVPKTVQLRFEYGKRNLSCPKDDIYEITFNIDAFNDHFISAEDGSILELNKNRIISTKFGPNSYCLNQKAANNRSFVGLVCPCKEKMCIQKCCPKGQYFNTVERQCKADENIPDYKPKFYNLTEPRTNESVPYFLKFRSTKCYKPDEIIVKEDTDIDLIYVQLNGYLLVDVPKEESYNFYDNTRYCLDIFSKGPKEKRRLNGFYCSDSPNINFVYGKNTEKATTQLSEAQIEELKKKKKRRKGGANSLKCGVGTLVFLTAFCFIKAMM